MNNFILKIYYSFLINMMQKILVDLSVEVSDNGPGLSKEDQTRIFERFYRAKLIRVRNCGEGTVLGLSIVDAVMPAHGGTVSVTSEVGHGATFKLFFPIQDL
jgi:two-component system OmpR family sensor kinase